jgi:heme exporter protein D
VNSLQAFFEMGGYAAYVWPAYAVFFMTLIADTIAPKLRRHRVLRELRARLARQRARQGVPPVSEPLSPQGHKSEKIDPALRNHR